MGEFEGRHFTGERHCIREDQVPYLQTWPENWKQSLTQHYRQISSTRQLNKPCDLKATKIRLWPFRPLLNVFKNRDCCLLQSVKDAFKRRKWNKSSVEWVWICEVFIKRRSWEGFGIIGPRRVKNHCREVWLRKENCANFDEYLCKGFSGDLGRGEIMRDFLKVWRTWVCCYHERHFRKSKGIWLCVL